MFTLLNKNKNHKCIDTNLRQYIKNSIESSIKKYIKQDNQPINDKSIIVINELDNKEINEKVTNYTQLFGLIFFLSLPNFIHYLYSKK